jgi:hypothetical protein
VPSHVSHVASFTHLSRARLHRGCAPFCHSLPCLVDSSCFLLGRPSQVCSASPTHFLAWHPQLVRLLGNFPWCTPKARSVSNLRLVGSPWCTQGIQVTQLFILQVWSVGRFCNRHVRSSKLLYEYDVLASSEQ